MENEKIHIALHMAQCLENAGLPLDSGLAINAVMERPIITQKNQSTEKNGILLHPGSGSEKKNFSKEFWLALLERIIKGSEETQCGPFILIGPAEENLTHFFKDNIDKKLTGLKIVSGTNDLLSLLSRTRFFIGHDSGVTHLAAMSGVKTVALFRTSSVENWRPLGPDVHVIVEKRESDVIEEIIEEIGIDG